MLILSEIMHFTKKKPRRHAITGECTGVKSTVKFTACQKDSEDR